MKLLLIITIFFSSLFGWIGEITALKGDVKIIRNNYSISGTKGLKLEQKDIIKTSNNTKLQVIFKDNTVITIGKNSEVKISDYIFDNVNSKANFKLSHGIMKTLTGKIGKFAPKRFKIRTKNASIGIRGTYFVVESYKDVIKLGMIYGITEFTNLDNNKVYIVSKGKQLIFKVKEPNNVIIKDNFLENKTTNFKENVNSINIEDFSDTINNDINHDEKNSINQNTNKDNKIYTKFLEGLKDLF